MDVDQNHDDSMDVDGECLRYGLYSRVFVLMDGFVSEGGVRRKGRGFKQGGECWSTSGENEALRRGGNCPLIPRFSSRGWIEQRFLYIRKCRRWRGSGGK
jgi:hypothetical protein